MFVDYMVRLIYWCIHACSRADIYNSSLWENVVIHVFHWAKRLCANQWRWRTTGNVIFHHFVLYYL